MQSSKKTEEEILSKLNHQPKQSKETHVNSFSDQNPVFETNEYKYLPMMDFFSLGIQLYEMDHKGELILLKSNHEADRILLLENKRNLNQPIEKAVPFFNETDIPDNLKRVALKGRSWRKHEIIYQKNKIKGVFEIQAFQPSPGRTAAIYIDITQLNLDESSLKQGKEKYHTLFELLHDVYFRTDKDGRITHISPSIRMQAGYRPEEMIGRQFNHFCIYPSEHDTLIRRLKKAGSVDDHEIKLRTKNGKMIIVSINSRAILDDENEFSGEEGIIRNITRRKKIEESLRISEEQFKTILQSVPDAYLLSDIKGYIEACNKSTEELLGYNREELLGKNISNLNLFSKEQETKAADILDKILSETPISPVEFELDHKSGNKIAVEIITVPVKIRNRPLLLVIIRDITQHKKTERELLIAKQRAESANQAKSDFLTSISHELRTPLNAIIGFSQVLEGKHFGELNEKQSNYIKVIRESGQHLLDMINEILDLSRIESGKMKLELTQTNVRDLIENGFNMIRQKCLKHRIALSLNISKEVDNKFFQFDERRLKQVIFNLLMNAAKFTPDDGAIRVKAYEKNRYLTVSVSDTGIGIPKKFQKKIFEPFYQIKGGIKGKTSGLGLGLNLCKRIVELHNGKIWVESEGRGRGSVFSISLPLNY
jgi:PAS domain S-box-containing protein